MSALQKVQEEAISQIVDSPVIGRRLSTNLKKFAGLMALSLVVSGMAADANAGSATANKIAALLAGGAGIGYLGGNTDGAKSLGAAAAGALVGGQIGKGNGSIAASIVGAGLGYAYVNGSQNQQRMNQQNGYNNGYNNNGYNNGYNNNNGNYRPAGYGFASQPVYGTEVHPQQVPQNTQVLYQVQGGNGGGFFVTADTSPAMRQMRGEAQASRALNDDPMVSRELNTSFTNFARSYEQLQQAYHNYENVAGGANIDNQRVRRQMLYSSDPNGITAVSNDNTRIQNLQQARQQLDVAANNYGVYKGTFFTNADNAAFEGFDVTGYAQAMDLVRTPEQIRVALNGSNKFPVVRQERVAFSLR